MRAYSMDLRERALLDSDAGMKAADVAAKYRVSGSWVRLLKQRRRETGEVAPRVQRHGRRGIVRLIRLDPKNLQSRTIRLQVDATRPGRRLGLV